LRTIELITAETITSRLESIRESYEKLYETSVSSVLEDALIERLSPTEPFLENDKLAVVFRKVIVEDYSVPIVVLKDGEVFFIIDGHHRAFIDKKLGKSRIQSYVLSLPSAHLSKRQWFSLDCLEIGEVVQIEDPELNTWARILKLLKYYEKIYKVPFQMRQLNIRIDELVPTQPVIEEERLYPLREPSVPIACLESGGRYYILDGHVRSLSARLLGQSTISAIILWSKEINRFGVEKNSESLGLTSLGDIRILGSGNPLHERRI